MTTQHARNDNNNNNNARASVITATTDQPTNNATGTAVTPRSDSTHRRCGRICNASSALNRGIAHMSAGSATSLNADNADSKGTSRRFSTDTTPARMCVRYASCQRNIIENVPPVVSPKTNVVNTNDVYDWSPQHSIQTFSGLRNLLTRHSGSKIQSALLITRLVITRIRV